MANETSAQQELRDRLLGNSLEDADDLTAYIQYASRLAALGDDAEINKLPSVFERSPFAGNVANILKTRCEQGIWEAGEYSGEALAFSLIDAQDFYCFQLRRGDSFPSVTPHFENWWEACEAAELDEDAAGMLRDFLDVYPIPEKERLPVVGTPITEFEYQLLDRLFADVKPRVIEMFWQPTSVTRPKGVIDTATSTVRPSLLLSCDDDKPSDVLKKLIQSTENHIETGKIELKLGRRLNDAWELQIFVEQPERSIHVSRIRIASIPAFQDAEEPNCWTIDLRRFAPQKRSRLLEQSMIVQLADGTIVECKTRQ